MKDIQTVSSTEFIFNTPLYQWVGADKEFLMDFVPEWNEKMFDGYNPDSAIETSYAVKDGYGLIEFGINDFQINQSEFTEILLLCCRSRTQMLITVKNDFENNRVMKVGQYPSIASIHIGQIQKYKKVMPKEDLKEFTRAIGLAANGVGIGSFVYLRRLFERLIQDAVEQKINAGEIERPVFEGTRMDEKIGMLRDVLPKFLVENRSIYGIISKGIHQLSEEECLAMFDILKTSIELILDEKKEMMEKESKMKTISAQLAQLGSKYRKS